MCQIILSVSCHESWYTFLKKLPLLHTTFSHYFCNHDQVKLQEIVSEILLRWDLVITPTQCVQHVKCTLSAAWLQQFQVSITIILAVRSMIDVGESELYI